MILPNLGALLYVLLPMAAAAALLGWYLPMRRAVRLELVTSAARMRLNIALALSSSFLLLNQSALFFELSLWVPFVGAALLIGVSLLLRSARAGVHTGLRGFSRPIPRDGVDWVEQRAREGQLGYRRRVFVWRVAPFVSGLVVSALLAGVEPARTTVWALLALAGVEPALC